MIKETNLRPCKSSDVMTRVWCGNRARALSSGPGPSLTLSCHLMPSPDLLALMVASAPDLKPLLVAATGEGQQQQRLAALLEEENKNVGGAQDKGRPLRASYG